MDAVSLPPVLGYRELLPFAWQAVASLEPAPGSAEQNLRMLTAIAALGERTRVEPEAPGALEFERLHHKVDLIVELLGALLRRERGAIPAVWLRLSSADMSWPAGAETPAVGSFVEVSVHLHACAPAPLQWRGEVVGHQDGEVQLRFAAMPEALASALERHVFTHHRRSVAGARSPAQRGDPAGTP